MMSESEAVYKTNSTGPNTEPCGTPSTRGDEEEAELLATTEGMIETTGERQSGCQRQFRDGKEEFGDR